MSNRTVVILVSLSSSGTFLGIFFTNNYNLLGCLIGFLTGLINIQWLSRDTKKAIDGEITDGLKIYYKSLFSRLGLVTFVVALVGVFRPDWLLFFVIGIAASVVLGLTSSIIKQIKVEGGEQ